MEKLQIFFEGEPKEEIVLRKAKIVLGRSGSGCDVCLDDKAVSRHHVSLIRGDSGYYAKDLGSTNGTVLNGAKIRSQLLKDGDVLRIGKHELKFITEPDEPGAETGAGEAPKREAGASPQRTYGESGGDPGPKASGGHLAPGQTGVRFLEGPYKGRLSVLDEPLFTIGRAQDQMATIARRPGGHYLIHVGGKSYPKVNGEPVQSGGVVLRGGDIIEVGEHRVAFLENSRPS